MSIRTQALKWFEVRYGKIMDPTYSSKYYQPEESWSKKSVWWFQIPISVVEENAAGYISLICQVAPGKNDFHFLKVPARFLQENLDGFHMVGDKISLYLSTDPLYLFNEERGVGTLKFHEFLVNTK